MTFFVTGAGSGIGLHLAKLMAQRGERVAAFDVRFSDEARDELSHAFRSPGGDGCSIHDGIDVRNAELLGAAFESAVAAVGRPTLVINSAGISRNDLFVDSCLEDFEQTIAVNLVGSRNVAAAALPHMRAGSRLGLIASLAGLTGGYTYAAYASSKAGVIGLAKVLRLEWASQRIGVSVICPPEIMTPMVEQYATTMHPATRALKDVAGTLPMDEACREILDLLDSGRFMVIPGKRARRAARMTRYLPERVTTRMADRIVRRAIQTTGPAI